MSSGGWIDKIVFDEDTRQGIIKSLGREDLIIDVEGEGLIINAEGEGLIIDVEKVVSEYYSGLGKLDSTRGEVNDNINAINESANELLDKLKPGSDELDLLIDTLELNSNESGIDFFKSARETIYKIIKLSVIAEHGMKTMGRPTDENKELFIYQLGIIWNQNHSTYPWHLTKGKKQFRLFVDTTSNPLNNDFHIRHDSRIFKTFLDKMRMRTFLDKMNN